MLFAALKKICEMIHTFAWNTVSPKYLLSAAVLLCCLLLAGQLCVRNGKASTLQVTVGSLLLTYLYLVFGATVFCRVPRETISCILRPFWSYAQAIIPEKKTIRGMIARNIVMLFPMGFLLPLCMGNKRISLRLMVSVTLTVSYMVEFLQLLLKRGTFELVDDPFSNLTGALLGYGLFCLLSRLQRIPVRHAE